MSPNPIPHPGPVQPPAPRRDALLLALIAFVLGIVLAGAWYHHHLGAAAQIQTLSPAARELVAELPAPVSIHYFALLPPDSADASLQNFAGRVTQLLEALQAASHGKLQVTWIDTPADTNTDLATANGLQGFNLNKGNGCYLGLTVASGQSRQIFARLEPKWEPALQFDLARAIARVAAENAPVTPASAADKPGPETLAAVQHLIPDVKSTTAEQADRILHEAFLKNCRAVATATEAKLDEAQQQVVQAQAGGSPATIDAARKHLLQVQMDGADQLKKLAAQLQMQLAAFDQLKTDAGNTGNADQ